MSDQKAEWGVLAGDFLSGPKPEKWDQETTKMRLEDHCRALVNEGNSREDTLLYLLEYNRGGSENPKWFAERLPELVELHEATFATHDRENNLIAQCSPVDWKTQTAQAIVERKMNPRTALVTENGMPVFYRKSVNQIFSWRGVGKSLFALGLANLMAGGGRMLAWECNEPREVLYIDGELPEEQSQERLREFVRPKNLKHVHMVSPDLLGLDKCINLFDPHHAQAVRRMIDDNAIEVVVLDSQAMLMPGDPLKTDFQDARSRLLQEYRLAGLCVIEIHHGGKSREQRGSSRNDDPLDIQIRLAEPNGWESGDGLQFEVQFKKVRHNARLESGYTVSAEGGEWKRVQSDIELEVGRMLEEGKPQREIAKTLDISQPTVSRIMKKITRDGNARLNDKASK